MSVILDYATPKPSKWETWKKVFIASPLWGGLIVYAFLCVPAATQRGYPPIDHFWTGVTYLWPFPVPLFILLGLRGGFSKNALIIYAIVSGYIDACTFFGIVPHRFSFVEGALNSIVIIPIHLAVVGVLAWICRFVVARLERPQEDGQRRLQTPIQISTFITIILIASIFPVAYRQIMIHRQEQAGRDRADADWTQHTAEIRTFVGSLGSRHSFGDADITCYFDTVSGLPLGNDMHMGFEPAYEARIQELLRIHGVPEWSQKSRLVSDADLVSMLTATDMQTVTEFPFDAAPGIVLFRNGTITRWGCSFGSTSNDLSIGSQFSGSNGFGNFTDTAYVGRMEKYPGVVFVRCGQKCVFACTEDGWILGYALRN